jgi:hypothetical protein
MRAAAALLEHQVKIKKKSDDNVAAICEVRQHAIDVAFARLLDPTFMSKRAAAARICWLDSETSAP